MKKWKENYYPRYGIDNYREGYMDAMKRCIEDFDNAKICGGVLEKTEWYYLLKAWVGEKVPRNILAYFRDKGLISNADTFTEKGLSALESLNLIKEEDL